MEHPQWSTQVAETVLAALTGVVLFGLTLVVKEPAVDVPGRFLGLVAGLGLCTLAASDLTLRPRLAAGPDGLAIRTVTKRVRLPWPDVEAIRLDERQRFGMRIRTLEIDSGDQLFLFGRRALGTDPLSVAEALSTLRPG